MRLGELGDRLAECDPDKTVVVVDGDRVLGNADDLDSWRGVYAELAVNYDGNPMGAGTLAAICRAADGQTFHGYKGGDFRMDRYTPVWVDNYGNYTGRMLLAVEETDTEVRLVTMLKPEEYR